MEILKWAFYVFLGLIGFAIAIYFIFSPLMLIVGMFKPSAVLPDDEPQTRPRVLLRFGITTVIMALLISSGAFSPTTAQPTSDLASNPWASPASESETVTSESVSQESTAPPEATKPIEEWIDVTNNRAIQIKGFKSWERIPPEEESDSEMGFLKPIEAKGGQLITVVIKLKNTGLESGNMTWSKFQIVDGQGRKYSEIDDFKEMMTVNALLEAGGAAKSSDQLFPGQTAGTMKVFRVAPDASDFKMAVNGQSVGLIPQLE